MNTLPVRISKNQWSHYLAWFAVLAVVAGAWAQTASQQSGNPEYGVFQQVLMRNLLVGQSSRNIPTASGPLGVTTPAQRRAAIDAYWGEGPSTEAKLAIFEKFWNHADQRFAAFQGIEVDWAGLRARYRAEIAAGVSRGRFAAIMNHLALALRDSHSHAYDLLVNFDTIPGPGVPLLGVGGWVADPSGTCMTALDDGSALVYSAVPNHPLGLEPGDVVLGYDGQGWRQLYQELLLEEVPLWPLWWGSSPSSFDHSFVMAAGQNLHLFNTMDIRKHSSGEIIHVPTNLMTDAVWQGSCSEQMDIRGVRKPPFDPNDSVRFGVVSGTTIGYIYVWGWLGDAVDAFAEAVYQLTQVGHVDGLIIDFRFNRGGYVFAPFRGLGVLSSHPAATTGMDARLKSSDHFAMKSFFPPSYFTLDFDNWAAFGIRVKASYQGSVAILVGPGAVSAGDFGAVWAESLPRARTFGKPTSMAVGFPTQPFLGTELDLGRDWYARIAETNTYSVGAPQNFLIHTEFRVDEPVWLTPDDVAAGKDSVVIAALRWLHAQIGP
jgi:Peptidase family S41